jgi:hypothetical protein
VTCHVTLSESAPRRDFTMPQAGVVAPMVTVDIPRVLYASSPEGVRLSSRRHGPCTSMAGGNEVQTRSNPVTIRKHIIAGLVVTLGIPALATATPSFGIGEAQQIAETGTGYTGSVARTASAPMAATGAAFDYAHQQAMNAGASHLDANVAAAGAVAQTIDPNASSDWLQRHKAAMDRGLDHIAANQAAGAR